MLISLNWIRDFIDLPSRLDPRELAERFTRTTAEVEAIEPVRVTARGLTVARVRSVTVLAHTSHARLVELDVGGGRTVETVTAAAVVRVGSNIVYAPVGSSVAALGEIGTARLGGKESVGMIVPGDALGITLAIQEAVFLDDTMEPGESLPPDWFDDWVMEIDNKSITHRPDLWGHYGVARELAAIYGQPLKPYPVVPIEELNDASLPSVEITITDQDACRRYSSLVVAGVSTQPAPLWMQLRLGRIGMRPISGLVDLTNYIMADLGQPMHAFDAHKVNRIGVSWAGEAERFTTLDGVERTLTRHDLMIQSHGKSVALAGLMGGLESEVSDQTTMLLLESANFHPTIIRKTANRLALRTDASARFEKSLDPSHTVLAIQRFIQLARSIYPDLTLKSRLSDAYPNPLEPMTVSVDAGHVARTIGREVPRAEMERILKPLGFSVSECDNSLSVSVPSFRATGDVAIEVDVIEEIARYIGYNTFSPAMPRVMVRRFEPNAIHELERRSLDYFTTAQGFHEIQGYLWYDSAWLEQMGIQAGRCVELKNPAAEGLERLRRSLMPGMFAALVTNRFHFQQVSLLELGSVFEPGDDQDEEFRHVGLLVAQRGRKKENELFSWLKGAIEGWGWQEFGICVEFAQTPSSSEKPWEHSRRSAAVCIDGSDVGRIGVVDMTLRRAMDEHLAAWSATWAEIRLTGLDQRGRTMETLDSIPAYPLVEMDFSILVPASNQYHQVARQLKAFEHPLLVRIRYVGSYDGVGIGPDRRSLTFRTLLGCRDRTLVDEDLIAFRPQFQAYLTQCGYEIRQG